MPILSRLFKKKESSSTQTEDGNSPTTIASDTSDVKTSGFPLIPDDYHLTHVGKTAQGNGYWITPQLVAENDKTRDFVAAYIFDKEGSLISCEVIDQGERSPVTQQELPKVIKNLARKIDAKETTEIIVKPFATSFYGYTFGLVIREAEDGEEPLPEILIDAMPGWTLMFYGPWSQCNYDT